MRQVIVNVSGVLTDGTGAKNTIELLSLGQSYLKNNATIITYKESMLTGMENTTTVLKVYPNEVVLVRRGSVTYRQEFCVGQKRQSPYITPYGNMKMQVDTSKLGIDLTDSLGTINIEYDLFIEDQFQSTNNLTITVREDHSNGRQSVTAGNDHCCSPKSNS